MQINPPLPMHTRDAFTVAHPGGVNLDASLAAARHLKEVHVCQLRSIGRSKLWNDVRAGLFPPPIKISPGCTRWVAADVLAWLEDPVGWVAREHAAGKTGADPK